MLFEKILYKSFYLLKIKIRENPYLIFFENIEKSKPVLSIKFKIKTKKKNKQIIIVPIYINLIKQYKKVIKWLELSLIIQGVKNKYFIKLFYELIDLYFNNESFMLKKKNENYKFIVLNKFNKNYRW
jgi:ribosomal protein S7